MATTNYDDMSLNDLLDLAIERGVPGYHPWSDWMEQYYDPAKSALIELLDWHEGVVAQSRPIGTRGPQVPNSGMR